jgi:glycosyltransferase involved in cell wall biosynthesis
MGYGLPVVTTDDTASSNPEIDALKAWVNGMTYRHGSARDMAEVIGCLMSDRERLRRMSEEAIRTATSEHTLKRMVDGIVAAVRYADEARRRGDHRS